MNKCKEARCPFCTNLLILDEGSLFCECCKWRGWIYKSLTKCTESGCRNLETRCKDCGRCVCEKKFPKSEWIGVEDRFPPNEDWVLVLCKGFFFHIESPLKQTPSLRIFEGRFIRSWGWDLPFCGDKDVHVTHWMPLPTPPEGK